MTKTELLNRFSNDAQQRLLLARLLDQKALAENRGIPADTGFLSPNEQALAQDLLSACPPARVQFFGGFEGAERKLCAFLPDWQDEEGWQESEDNPVCALRAEQVGNRKLNHRDYLGSLMGLGITREKIGDILLEGNVAYILLRKELRPIVLSQWDKAGRVPLKLCPIPLAELKPTKPDTRLMRDTVASLRLDAVTAAGFSLSRSRAAELIAAGRVMHNYRECNRPDRMVKAGDGISCRGLGKFVLTEAEGRSKKGRIILQIERYI